MKLIMLTEKCPFSENSVICINVAHIIAFTKADDGAAVKLNGKDEWVIVAESADEVMRRIQFAKAM